MPSILFNAGSSGKRLEPTEAAYVAGFVDGEGCLTIGRAARKENRSGFMYHALFTIGNTNLDGLRAIVAMCGNGKVQLSDKRKALGHKPMYRIVFSHGQIRHLLPQLRPYMNLKGRQADLLLAFLDTKVNGQHVTDDDLKRWEGLRSEIRTLNLRGIKDTAPQDVTMRPQNYRWGKRSTRTCQIDGCEREHYGKDYCWMHYRKFVLRGGPKQYQRNCVVCGEGFTAKRKDTECCSKKCGDKRYYESTKRASASLTG
jgi:hypothetical protein